MRIIKIKNCKECPYFGSQMNQDEKTFGELQLMCFKKEEGYLTFINYGNKINCLVGDTDEEADELIDKQMNDLDFDIPGWCPLEELKKEVILENAI